MQFHWNTATHLFTYLSICKYLFTYLSLYKYLFTYLSLATLMELSSYGRDYMAYRALNTYYWVPCQKSLLTSGLKHEIKWDPPIQVYIYANITSRVLFSVLMNRKNRVLKTFCTAQHWSSFMKACRHIPSMKMTQRNIQDKKKIRKKKVFQNVINQIQNIKTFSRNE